MSKLIFEQVWIQCMLLGMQSHTLLLSPRFDSQFQTTAAPTKKKKQQSGEPPERDIQWVRVSCGVGGWGLCVVEPTRRTEQAQWSDGTTEGLECDILNC